MVLLTSAYAASEIKRGYVLFLHVKSHTKRPFGNPKSAHVIYIIIRRLSVSDLVPFFNFPLKSPFS